MGQNMELSYGQRRKLSRQNRSKWIVQIKLNYFLAIKAELFREKVESLEKLPFPALYRIILL